VCEVERSNRTKEEVKTESSMSEKDKRRHVFSVVHFQGEKTIFNVSPAVDHGQVGISC
jgi:hypothetical protein